MFLFIPERILTNFSKINFLGLDELKQHIKDLKLLSFKKFSKYNDSLKSKNLKKIKLLNLDQDSFEIKKKYDFLLDCFCLTHVDPIDAKKIYKQI